MTFSVFVLAALVCCVLTQTAVPTETIDLPTTDAPVEPPTDAPTEQPTEALTSAPTPAKTKAPTRARPTRAPTDPVTTSPTEASIPTDPPTEASSLPPTSEPTPATTSAPTSATDSPTNTVAPTENAVTSAPTESVATPAPTEHSVTSAPTEAVDTAAPTERSVSSAPTEAKTPAPTEVASSAPTEPETWGPTEAGTPAPTETPATPAPTEAGGTSAPTEADTPAPTLDPCYVVNVDGAMLTICNGTDVPLLRRMQYMQLSYPDQYCAWFRFNLPRAGDVNLESSVYVIDATYDQLYDGKRLIYSFFDRTGRMLFDDTFPDYDTEDQDNRFVAQIQKDTNDTVYLRIITPGQKQLPIGNVTLRFQLACNYTFNTTSPPWSYKLSQGYLYANWRLDQLGGPSEGMAFLQITSSCTTPAQNELEVYITQCRDNACTYPRLFGNQFPMLTGFQRNEPNSITSQLGFPLANITAQNNNLVVVVKQLRNWDCEVTLDAYVAQYQSFKFSSFKTYAYSTDVELKPGRYQPMRVIGQDETFPVNMRFHLPNEAHTHLSMFYSDSQNDKANNIETGPAFQNVTGPDDNKEIQITIGAPYKAFSILNTNAYGSGSTVLSVSFSTGRFSWGYYCTIVLGVALVLSTLGFVYFLRPKPRDVEVLQPLLIS